MVSLLDFFTSTFSLYSLAMNYNMSYQWRLVPGEVLVIAPQAPGAYVACRPYSNLSVRFAVSQADAYAISQHDISSLAGIDFGSQWGRIELTSFSDVTFLVHIRFINYAPDQACRPLFRPNDTDPVDLPQQVSSDGLDVAGTASLADDLGSVNTLPIITFSIAATVIVIFLIIQNRHRDNHQNYEEMDISDDEDLDNYIPTVVDRSVPGHGPPTDVASPYVVCVINEGAVTKCSQPDSREGLQ
jgi:hypothetical protein